MSDIPRRDFLKVAGASAAALAIAGCAPKKFLSSPETISSDITLDNLIHGATPQSWIEMSKNPLTLVKTIASTSFELSKQYLADNLNDPSVLNLQTNVTTSTQEFIQLVTKYKDQAQLTDQYINSLAATSNAAVIPLYTPDKTAVIDQIIIIQTNQITKGINFDKPLTPETINLISLLFLQSSFHEIIHVQGRPKFNFSSLESDQILQYLDTLNVNNLTESQFNKILQVFSQHGVELIIKANNSQTQEVENYPIFYYLEEARNALIRDHLLSPKTRLLLNDYDRELAEFMRFTLKEFLSITDINEWYEKNSTLKFPDLINWYQEKSLNSNYHLEVRDITALLGKMSIESKKIFDQKNNNHQEVNFLELAKNSLLNAFKPWGKNY